MYRVRALAACLGVGTAIAAKATDPPRVLISLGCHCGRPAVTSPGEDLVAWTQRTAGGCYVYPDEPLDCSVHVEPVGVGAEVADGSWRTQVPWASALRVEIRDMRGEVVRVIPASGTLDERAKGPEFPGGLVLVLKEPIVVNDRSRMGEDLVLTASIAEKWRGAIGTGRGSKKVLRMADDRDESGAVNKAMNLAWWSSRHGRHHDVVAHARTVTERRPDVVSAWTLLARSLCEVGDVAAAAEAMTISVPYFSLRDAREGDAARNAAAGYRALRERKGPRDCREAALWTGAETRQRAQP